MLVDQTVELNLMYPCRRPIGNMKSKEYSR